MPWSPLRWLVPAVVLMSLSLGACASPGASPSTRPAPTAGAVRESPAAQPPGDSSDAPAVLPAESPASRITLAGSGSTARYRAREQFVGASLPNEAVGSTSDVSGAIVVDGSGGLVPEQSRIVVNLRTLRSDESRRDQYIQANTLETQQFPEAVFVAREVRGAPSSLPASGEATFQLLGDLTVHGVTRPTVWDVTVRFAGAEMSGLASTRVNMTDFGMAKPQVARLLSIDDALTVELEFQGLVAPEPSSAAHLPASNPS